jgi:rhamnulokinase
MTPPAPITALVPTSGLCTDNLVKESPAFLAFDLGAESGRAVLGRLRASQIELQEIHRFPNGPVLVGNSLYWDVLRLWSEMKHGLTLAAREAGNSLVSLGVDTWGVDFALLDANDSLIGNPHNYRDSRTDRMVEAACSVLSRHEIYQQTGVQIMPINSLYQLLAMAKSGSGQLSAAWTFLNMPDLFNFWFSGVKVSEFTITTTTQCYDPQSQDWARDMLEKMGIHSDIFGEIVPPGTILGGLSAYLAAETGAGDVKVVAVASHDTQSAIVAVPATTDDFLYLSSGTWSLMGTEVAVPVINGGSLDYNLTNEGGYGGKFCLLKNIVGLWILQECRRAWAASGQSYSYDDLTQLAASAPALRAFIDPANPRFLPPGEMVGRIQAFCRSTGQVVPETPAEISRCVLESLALEYRRVADQISNLLGRPFPVIHIIGGGSRNALMNQFAANATGRKVISGPVEATAIGNILVQAIAAGQIGSLAQARTVVRNSFDVSVFEPCSSDEWNKAYRLYLNLKAEVAK